jgi:hypothetical protein
MAKQGEKLSFAESWDLRLSPIRNYQTVSEGVFSETGLPAVPILGNPGFRQFLFSETQEA